MELRQLEALVWVATLGSFSAAADHLRVTQPAISTRVTSLETELGTVIFERLGRRVRLTPRGQDLFDQAQQMLGLANAMRDVASGKESYRGLLRIGVTTTVLYTLLPALVAEINAAFPAVDLELQVTIAPDMTARLAGRDLDLVVSTEPVEGPGIANEFLLSHSMNWVGHTELGLPPDPVPLATIARHNIITFSYGTASYNNIIRLLRTSGCELPRVVTTNSTTCIMQLLESKLGIGTLPALVLASSPRTGKLRVIRSDVALPNLSLFVCYRTNAFTGLNKAVAAMLARIGASFQGNSIN